MLISSKETARAAIMMSMTQSREEERACREELLKADILSAAVDCGGAKREGVIKEGHIEEGGVAGAAHEALSQIMNKALGLSVGGKIGIARKGDHIAVAAYFAIGLLHLNDIAVGLGHRAI